MSGLGPDCAKTRFWLGWRGRIYENINGLRRVEKGSDEWDLVYTNP